MWILRRLIREMLSKDEVLGEPDESAESSHKDEQSVAVAGATTPLGTGPTYPNKSSKPYKKIKNKNLKN
tara:strand:+ start:251 stop:457 length:207 start_codon:yes stop_codon:yes gene_type:complete